MGTIRVLRTRAIDWKTALALAAIPLVLVVSISYGNEVLFRAFFFGLPFLSLLAAALWYGRAPTPRREAIAQGTLTAILGGMLILSFISTYGNDAATTFTAKEVAAANEMYDEASPH